MKQFIKEYFTFNRREQRGILVLLTIIILLLIFLIVLKTTAPAQHYDFTAFEKEITELEKGKAIDTTGEEYIDHFEHNNIEVIKKNTEKFDFNPNNLPAGDWKRLGFSDKQIRTIKNYENKGGKFYKKEDLKKIYGISEAQYTSIESNILIPPKNSKKFIKPDNSPLEKQVLTFKLELNSADSLQLVKLKGIGPAFASRILKYRNKLGGFISDQQLKEIFGIDSARYEIIVKQIVVDPEKAGKININEVTIEQLKNHPYIKYKTASLIVNYRNKHGLYKSVMDIKNIHAIPDSLFSKAAPYLTLN